jgi:hypothetical protein
LPFLETSVTCSTKCAFALKICQRNAFYGEAETELAPQMFMK